MGIYIWGTGCGAGEITDLLRTHGCPADRIAAYVDNFPSGESFQGRPVLRSSDLPVSEVRLLLVTSRHTEAIREQCLSLGLSPDVLLFTKNHYRLTDLNTSYETVSCLLGEAFAQAVRTPCRIIREPAGCPDRRFAPAEADTDYVRIKTLELLADSLARIPGAAAELGVYRGDFAREINRLLPDRTLYLFDSFAGFRESEAGRECRNDTCGEAFVEAHRNTAASRVLDRMPHPDRILLRPGFFPESARGLEETFALVSLDADFEDTTYAGLSWFWPRLISGGFLLLHDYNAPRLRGVRQAVARYEADTGLRLPGVPLCDTGGTIVFCKP